ncbi:MAG: HD domain-containing protein, partial [Eubacteriales bacterium]|nr:HD domain-containing protein [Eubacteriales bacterium]
NLIGRSHYDVFPELPQALIDVHTRCLLGASEKSDAKPFYRKDGRMDWVSWEIHPWYLAYGQIGGIVLFSEVVTDRINADIDHRQNEQRQLKAMKDIIEVISKSIEMRDPYTAGHQVRVTRLVEAICDEMNLPTQQSEGISLAALIHDLGKLFIPSDYLTKPGRLTELEYNIIKTHSQAGYDILKNVEFTWPVAEMVLQHHERINGSGYPHQLTSESIQLGAKIIMVADVVEAIASHRPYRPAKGIESALQEITDNRGTLFDTTVVDACLCVFLNGFNFELAS